MRTIATAGACTPHRVSLIYSRFLDTLVLYVYDDGALIPLSAAIIPAIPT